MDKQFHVQFDQAKKLNSPPKGFFIENPLVPGINYDLNDFPRKKVLYD